MPSLCNMVSRDSAFPSTPFKNSGMEKEYVLCKHSKYHREHKSALMYLSPETYMLVMRSLSFCAMNIHLWSHFLPVCFMFPATASTWHESWWLKGQCVDLERNWLLPLLVLRKTYVTFIHILDLCCFQHILVCASGACLTMTISFKEKCAYFFCPPLQTYFLNDCSGFLFIGLYIIYTQALQTPSIFLMARDLFTVHCQLSMCS